MQETVYSFPGMPFFALLSDFHNGDPAPILASLEARRPQFICLAGDLIRGGRPEKDVSPLTSQKNALPFLRSCAAIAPVYLSLGNHDLYLDQADLDLLTDAGATLLDNSWVTFTLSGRTYCLGGLTSASTYHYRQYRAAHRGGGRYPKRPDRSGLAAKLLPTNLKPFTRWLPQFAAAPGVHILLCHNPEYYPLLPASLELVLAGHAHGGQWRFYSPKTGRMEGLYAPGQGIFPRWTRGVYEGRMVVSAGLTNTTILPRISNPPEIVYVWPAEKENDYV